MDEARELSRRLDVGRLGGAVRTDRIDADVAERAGLARRLALDAILSLHAETRTARLPGDGAIAVEGRLTADVVQRCVVTLEPFSSRVTAEFRRVFTTAASPVDREIVIDAERDEPEPLDGDVVDLGEIVAEELALALDPYPRSPEADAAMRAFESEAEASARTEPSAATRRPH
ncbi:MAG: DUF177 domain-containing protein [Geminicoccaceae bacterium]|nr:DUF177 domain-containing protein [Geminicoccaceae bacterium]MCX8099802.1 DUF177 domain-containing protein [Geminicoccaceae bacterium]MDW8368778.1 DUF177 domain-containing protein [Geminicoccaceae bacterium]